MRIDRLGLAVPIFEGTDDRTWIVTSEDGSVLDPTSERSLTLVTCYPSYFVGSAPQRFIVRC